MLTHTLFPFLSPLYTQTYCDVVTPRYTFQHIQQTTLTLHYPLLTTQHCHMDYHIYRFRLISFLPQPFLQSLLMPQLLHNIIHKGCYIASSCHCNHQARILGVIMAGLLLCYRSLFGGPLRQSRHLR